MVLPETDAQRAARDGRRGARHPHRRQGPRAPGRGAADVRARRRAHRAGDGAGRRRAGHALGARPSSTSACSPRTRRSTRSGSRRCGASSARSSASCTRSAGRSRPRARYREFGGTFAYPMGPDTICLGLVVGLDYADATLSVHDLLQEAKGHPLFRRMLEGGERIAWGAKAIPEGGFWSMPASVSPAGRRDPGRRRRLRQRAAPEGRPLRAAQRHAGRGDDPPRARRRRRSLAAGRALALRRPGAQLRDLPRPAPLPEHAPGLPARPDRRRRAGRRDGHAARRPAALATADAPRRRAARVRRQRTATASATAS